MWLTGTFLVSIAPPFAILSATAPLIQHWYARSGRPDADDLFTLPVDGAEVSLLSVSETGWALFTAVGHDGTSWLVGPDTPERLAKHVRMVNLVFALLFPMTVLWMMQHRVCWKFAISW